MMQSKRLAIVAAVMIVLISGCAGTPAKFRERNGDFVVNIAVVAPATATTHC